MIIRKHAKFWGIPIYNVGGDVHTNSKWKRAITPSKMVQSNVSTDMSVFIYIIISKHAQFWGIAI